MDVDEPRRRSAFALDADARSEQRIAGRRSALPGFGLTMGVTLSYLSLIVLLPLASLFLKAATGGPAAFARVALSRRALLAYQLSFGTALLAAAIDMVFGLLIAWVLARYRFPFRAVVNAFVDLPFALPTAVAGIALTALYTSGGLLGHVAALGGVKIAYTAAGITIALIFVGLPFAVRAVEPVLADIGRDIEEAAASLGASRLHTVRRVLLPAIAPAMLTGFALSFARGVGEYGSVIFIAGNMPYRTEIAPLLIVTELEQFDYAGATGIAVVMLVTSFLVLLLVNGIQAWTRRNMAAA